MNGNVGIEGQWNKEANCHPGEKQCKPDSIVIFAWLFMSDCLNGELPRMGILPLSFSSSTHTPLLYSSSESRKRNEDTLLVLLVLLDKQTISMNQTRGYMSPETALIEI